MKKRSLFFGGLLLLTMTFGTTSCTIGGDDKKDEIVVNPLDKTQYYIVGTVSDANGGLDGVELSVRKNKKKKNKDGGQYSLTVTSSSAQDVSFSKEGMISYTAKAQFASDNNHSQAVLNVTLAKSPDLSKGEEVTATAEGATIEAPHQEDESADPAVIEIPAGGVDEGTKVTAVAYETPVDVNAEAAAFSNIYVETDPADAKAATEYQITVTNPGSDEEYFDESSMEMIKEDAPATKAAGAEVEFDQNGNSYLITMKAGTRLAGSYFLNLKFDKSVSNKTGDYNPVIYNGKTYNSTVQIENAEYSAMQNVKLTVQAKYGWEYTIEPKTALATAGATGLLAETIKEHINKIEGKQTYTRNEEYTASVSGHKVLYFSSRQNVTEKTYTFKVKIGRISKSVVVKLNCYNGHTVNHEEKDLSDHSGGTTGVQS